MEGPTLNEVRDSLGGMAVLLTSYLRFSPVTVPG